MFFSKCVLALAVFIGVNSRYVYRENYLQPKQTLEEANILEDNYEDAMSERLFEPTQPGYILLARLPAGYVNLDDAKEDSPSFEDQSRRRVARQAQGKVDFHVPDQKIDLTGSVPLTGDDKNVLSAFGKVQGFKPGQGIDSAGAGLVLENAKGHSLAVMGSNIPDLGNRFTAAGTVNLMKTPNHNLDTTAFVAKTLPNNQHIPDFTTYGGNFDYTYNNKFGASLAAQHTPAFDRTDISAMGNLNLFKTPTSSVDFSSGISRTITPFRSFNEPRFDFTYSRNFNFP